jgi:hypothetical protein
VVLDVSFSVEITRGKWESWLNNNVVPKMHVLMAWFRDEWLGNSPQT